jgi:hypothetical protein
MLSPNDVQTLMLSAPKDIQTLTHSAPNDIQTLTLLVVIFSKIIFSALKSKITLRLTFNIVCCNEP